MKKIIISLLFLGLAWPAYSQTDEEAAPLLPPTGESPAAPAKDTSSNVFKDGRPQVWVQGSLGMAASLYGASVSKDGSGGYSLGGFGFGGDVSLAYSVLGARLSYMGGTIGDLEGLEVGGKEVSFTGSGFISNFQPKLGLMLGTDKGDQSYFWLYTGYLISSASYDRTGVDPYPKEVEDALGTKEASTNLPSSGVTFGFEDVTLFGSAWQLGWVFGMEFSLARPSVYESRGNDIELSDQFFVGVTTKFGIRFAMDRIFTEVSGQVSLGGGKAKTAAGEDFSAASGLGGAYLTAGFYF